MWEQLVQINFSLTIKNKEYAEEARRYQLHPIM
jgi:hypothetical protein